jgi:hypothetical protein
MELLKPSSCVIKHRQRFSEIHNLIRKTKKGKTFEVGLIRDQGAKTLWIKRASKKRGPAKSEFPSLAGFLF